LLGVTFRKCDAASAAGAKMASPARAAISFFKTAPLVDLSVGGRW